jgi:retinoblastoma-like protein 2
VCAIWYIGFLKNGCCKYRNAILLESRVLSFISQKVVLVVLNLNIHYFHRIWTTFEYSMTKCPEIMRDRHLDQLIMCAIYVMSKVLRLNVTFQEIMRQYRHQPQAKSHVYRSVLLNNGKREVPIPDSPSGDLPRISSRARSTSTSLPQSPGEAEPVLPSERRLSSSSSSTMKEGERGDIINFYNKVYISYIKEFALKFQQNGVDVCDCTYVPLCIPHTAQNMYLNHHTTTTATPAAMECEYTV